MVISPNCVSFDGLKKVSTHSCHLSDVWGQNGKMVPVSPKGVSKSCFKLMILFVYIALVSVFLSAHPFIIFGITKAFAAMQ